MFFFGFFRLGVSARSNLNLCGSFVLLFSVFININSTNNHNHNHNENENENENENKNETIAQKFYEQ